MFATYAKLLKILDAGERRRFGLLVGMVVTTGLLDMVGVASVLPFLTVLAEPATIETNVYLATGYRWFGFQSTDQFILFLGMLTFVLVIVSESLKALTIYVLMRFSRIREFSIGSRLLEAYLNQPYAWHLGRHSADLGKSMLSEVDKVIQGAMIPALRVLAHGTVVFFLVALLVYIEPIGAIGMAIAIAGSYGAIFMMTRHYLGRIGRGRVRANAERYQLAQEALAAIKQIKLLGLESAYVRRFNIPALEFARSQATSAIIAELPRYLLQAIVFGGMIIFLLVLMSTSEGRFSAVLPTVGVFAFAGARLFPAIQQLYGGLSFLRFFRPALDTLHEDLVGLATTRNGLERTSGTPLRLRESIELRKVTYAYPGTDRPVLRNLDLTIRARTTVGFVGVTGAGKTTTVDIILGLLEPQSGVLAVDGTIIDETNRASWQLSVGYVPQEIVLIDDTVAANIALGIPPSEIDMSTLTRAARIAELHDFVTNELPSGYATTVGERGVRLSGGQRQRIGIARALYADPQVLVLDEATNALDGLTERAVMDAVRNLSREKTIVIIAHRLSTVRDCSEIFYFEAGQCSASGSYKQLMETNTGFKTLALSAEW